MLLHFLAAVDLVLASRKGINDPKARLGFTYPIGRPAICTCTASCFNIASERAVGFGFGDRLVIYRWNLLCNTTKSRCKGLAIVLKLGCNIIIFLCGLAMIAMAAPIAFRKGAELGRSAVCQDKDSWWPQDQGATPRIARFVSHAVVLCICGTSDLDLIKDFLSALSRRETGSSLPQCISKLSIDLQGKSKLFLCSFVLAGGQDFHSKPLSVVEACLYQAILPLAICLPLQIYPQLCPLLAISRKDDPSISQISVPRVDLHHPMQPCVVILSVRKNVNLVLS